MENSRTLAGYSLLECLLCMSILALLLSFALPSFSEAQRRTAMRSTLTQTYFLLKQARQLAIENQQSVSAVVMAEPSWCIGLTTENLCNCHVANSCMVSGEPYALTASDNHIVLSAVTFAEGDRTRFDGIHGTAYGHAGSVIYSDGERQGKVIVNNLGRVRLCLSAGELKGYASCN